MSDLPPRVALARPQAAGASTSEPHDFTDAQVEEYREQDRYLPIANVARIMKESLPPTAKIAKESKECIQECVSEFISFVTSEASERCLDGKRKTLNGEDVLEALTALGFDNYAETLKVYLAKYRMSQPVKPKRASSTKKPSAKGKGKQTAEDDEDEDSDEEEGSYLDDEFDDDGGAGAGEDAPPAAFFAAGQAGEGRSVRARLDDDESDDGDGGLS